MLQHDGQALEVTNHLDRTIVDGFEQQGVVLLGAVGILLGGGLGDREFSQLRLGPGWRARQSLHPHCYR